MTQDNITIVRQLTAGTGAPSPARPRPGTRLAAAAQQVVNLRDSEQLGIAAGRRRSRAGRIAMIRAVTRSSIST